MEVKLPEYKLEGLLDATIRMHRHEGFGEALMEAHVSIDVKPLADMVDRLDLADYRPYLLRWCHYLKCTVVCRRFCYPPHFF